MWYDRVCLQRKGSTTAMLQNELVRERRHLLDSELERYLDLLEAHYQPDVVLLFGSAATENIHEWSDLDLVIVKQTEERFLDRIKDVIALLQPKVGVDILVYTPQEFRQLGEERAFVRDEILAKSRVLYAK